LNSFGVKSLEHLVLHADNSISSTSGISLTKVNQNYL